MEYDKLIAQKLLQIKAIKLSPQNPFTWASGIQSPIYCDNRTTLSYPEVRTTIKLALKELSQGFGTCDIIAGVATAGIAHGALLADLCNLPFCYVRSAPKSHGRQNQIEGEIAPNARVIVVEDLISTGGSSIEVVNILREAGCNVLGVIAIFDYGFEKAKANFKSIDCKYASVSNYKTLISEAVDSGYITQEESETLANWNKDPENWFNNLKNTK